MVNYDDHDPSSSSPSSGGRRNHIGQLSTFQVAPQRDNDNDNDDDDHALKSVIEFFRVGTQEKDLAAASFDF